MHGVQWANWLKNQPGIKPDELQWTGLDNWLRSQEKLVTKKEVQDYLAKNEIKVGDTEYRYLTPDEIRELDDLKYKRDHYDHEDDLIDQGKWDELEKGHLFSDDDLIRLETLQEAELPKYEEYQLPDGENYRENLYKLPSEKYHITAKELAERDGLVWEDLNGYDQGETKDLVAVKLQATAAPVAVTRFDVRFDKKPWLYFNQITLKDSNGAVIATKNLMSAADATEITVATDYLVRFEGISTVVATATPIVRGGAGEVGTVKGPQTNETIRQLGILRGIYLRCGRLVEFRDFSGREGAVIDPDFVDRTREIISTRRDITNRIIYR
jgi:hypothetical protein